MDLSLERIASAPAEIEPAFLDSPQFVSLTWVCATAGNFGQGVSYAARARGAGVRVFAMAGAPADKLERMRALGAHVEVADRAEEAAREYAAESPDRILIKDGEHPAIAKGAGTIAVELERAGPIDTAIVQVGDGALITGVARWLKANSPRTRMIGVCASGAPATARSFAAGEVVADEGSGTIATARDHRARARVAGAPARARRRDRAGRRRRSASAWPCC